LGLAKYEEQLSATLVLAGRKKKIDSIKEFMEKVS
jgi:hypothetical protein